MIDHRRLGRELELFHTDPLSGAGLPIWLPAGAAARHAVEEYVRELERRAGYQHVYSPPLGKRELFELSGHLSHFAEDMFPVLRLSADDEFVLRPALCPQHALRAALSGVPYVEAAGEAAFYGPKIDIQIRDAADRESTISTIQLDFDKPEKFNLSYVDPTGGEVVR